MRALEGTPKFTESQRLPDVSYEGFARSLGRHGIAVDKPEHVGQGLGPGPARRPTDSS
jgi:pyruvate dehydrogenase (quinone)